MLVWDRVWSGVRGNGTKMKQSMRIVKGPFFYFFIFFTQLHFWIHCMRISLVLVRYGPVLNSLCEVHLTFLIYFFCEHFYTPLWHLSLWALPPPPPPPAQAALPGARGPAGGPGGVRHGALRDRGAIWRRRHQPAPVAAPLQPAHFLCALPVRQLPTHGALASPEGEVVLIWNRHKSFIEVDIVICPIIVNALFLFLLHFYHWRLNWLFCSTLLICETERLLYRSCLKCLSCVCCSSAGRSRSDQRTRPPHVGPPPVHIWQHSEERPGWLSPCHEAVRSSLPRERGSHCVCVCVSVVSAPPSVRASLQEPGGSTLNCIESCCLQGDAMKASAGPSPPQLTSSQVFH